MPTCVQLLIAHSRKTCRAGATVIFSYIIDIFQRAGGIGTVSLDELDLPDGGKVERGAEFSFRHRRRVMVRAFVDGFRMIGIAVSGDKHRQKIAVPAAGEFKPLDLAILFLDDRLEEFVLSGERRRL